MTESKRVYQICQVSRHMSCRFSVFMSESQFHVGSVSEFSISCRSEDAGCMTTGSLLETELIYLSG